MCKPWLYLYDVCMLICFALLYVNMICMIFSFFMYMMCCMINMLLVNSWYVILVHDAFIWYLFESLFLLLLFIRFMLRMIYIIFAPKCYHLNMGCINFSSCFFRDFVTLVVHFVCTYNLSKYFWYDKHLEVILSYKLIT